MSNNRLNFIGDVYSKKYSSESNKKLKLINELQIFPNQNAYSNH